VVVKKAEASGEIQILEIDQGEVSFAVLGITPFICNRMSAKAKHELLLPKGRMTAADKQSNLKHNPMQEFRDSFYRSKQEVDPTRAMMTAALDMPGAKKAQIGRLVWVAGTYVNLYGVPQISSAVVRSADINRTPDVRTRAILPEWACYVTVRFVRPILTATAVSNLEAASGMICGVGDWRQEKGSGNFGAFELVPPDDERFLSVVKRGGRAAQLAAIDDPVAFDEETEELMAWYGEDMKRRGRVA
jgi:hypothetical protein